MIKVKRNFSASALLSLILLFSAAGLASLKWLPGVSKPSWGPDEVIECLVARDMLDGKVIYRDAVTHRPPLQHLVLIAIFKIAGPMNMKAVHGALYLLILTTSGILYLTGTKASGGASGGFAALFFVMMLCTLPCGDALSFDMEYLLAFFSAAAAFLLLSGVQIGNLVFFLAAGACLGSAFFSKQPGFFDFAAMAGTLLVSAREPERRRFYLTALAALAAGFLLVSACFVSWLFLAGALRDSLYYIWTYNTKIYVGAMPVSRRLGSLSALFLTPGLRRIGACLAFALLASPVYLAVRRRAAATRENFYSVLLVFWTWLTFAGAAVSGRNFGHYYIQPAVPASLFLALAAGDLLRRAAALKRPLFSAAVFGFFSCLLWLLASGFFSTAPRMKYPDPSWAGLDTAGGYIRANSSPDDKLFVWGYAPDLYLMSDRKPAARFNHTNFLSGLIPGIKEDNGSGIVPGAWEQVIRDLEGSKPLFVADVSPGNYGLSGRYPTGRFPPLDRFLKENYSPDRIFTNAAGRPMIRLWRRKE